jgi:uncharacterized membrane protein
MRHRLIFLVVLLFPLAAPAAQANSYSVKVCNNSGKGKAWIAQHYYNVDAQNGVVQGWWGLDNGQCSTFTHSLGKYSASTWAYYAYTSKTQWSGSSEKRCVEKGSKFLNGNLGRPCSGKEQLVGFKQLKVRAGAATYAVNLVP